MDFYLEDYGGEYPDGFKQLFVSVWKVHNIIIVFAMLPVHHLHTVFDINLSIIIN